MIFKRFSCWQRERVYPVMLHDAENITDAIFLATHSDYPLRRIDVDERGTRTGEFQMPAQEFLVRFLDPARTHMQAAILGQSGSGKSHFIHWLKVSIRPSDRYHVVSIPRASISLRHVIEMLVDLLPSEQQERYRERLRGAGDTFTSRSSIKERLLSEIALALQNAPVSAADEAQQYLSNELPHLFNDPMIRKYWSDSNGIIQQLVDHIMMAHAEYQRRETRMVFQESDLPENMLDRQLLSAKARRIVVELADDAEMKTLAIALMNDRLNEAIARVLNFNGQQLIELMLDVRRALRQQDKELILLIEDFARLQGIDVALLEALIQSPSADDSLCTMRWAMAVTSGYYDTNIPATVKTRMDYVIDMDLPVSGELAVMSEEAVVKFTARYLNAVRLNEAELSRWYEHAVSFRQDEEMPPNLCLECRFRETCHASFGAVDGIGLYPFNRTAIRTMANRKKVFDDDRFQPRRFIKEVLTTVMGTFQPEIDSGNFPSSILLREMGGSVMKPVFEAQIKQMTNKDTFDRTLALLQLWGNEERLVMPPEGVFTAFALQPPQGVAEIVTPQQTLDVAVDVERPRPMPTMTAIDEHIAAVDRWSHGETLPQKTTTVLRDLLYVVITEAIDWDRAYLEKAKFAEKILGDFRQRSINFTNQQTQQTSGIVTLQIPSCEDDDQLRHAALALIGLLQFSQHGSWDFPDAFIYLPAVSNCVALWSQSVVEQIKYSYRPQDATWEWNPVASAIELLMLGALLAGKIKSFQEETSTIIEAMFTTWPPIAPLAHWPKISEELTLSQELLRDIVRSRCSGTKGGQSGAFLTIDSIEPLIFQFARNATLTPAPPRLDVRGDEYSKLAQLTNKMSNQLVLAIDEELNFRSSWLTDVDGHIGTARKAEIIETARNYLTQVNAIGIPYEAELKQRIDASVRRLNQSALDTVIDQHRHELQRRDPKHLLPFLCSRPKELEMMRSFLQDFESLESSVRKWIDGQRQKQGSNERELQDAVEGISITFTELDNLLEHLGGKNDA